MIRNIHSWRDHSRFSARYAIVTAADPPVFALNGRWKTKANETEEKKHFEGIQRMHEFTNGNEWIMDRRKNQQQTAATRMCTRLAW